MLIGFIDMADWFEGHGYYWFALAVRYSPWGLVELAVVAILRRTKTGRRLLEF